jgi:2-C-methyl-D-erythritol 4-phosphate cytidylyltransferase/2-C-methyl-D-erythritol 2,4-cyclodiphosphate synthase
MSVSAVIVAAGRGSRIGDGPPKQYRLLAGKTVLARSIDALCCEPAVESCVVVIHPDDGNLYGQSEAEVRPEHRSRLLPPVSGGETRQESVRRGLEALKSRAPAIVLVHDAARPFATPSMIEAAIAAARRRGAAVPGVVPTDTIKIVDDAGVVVDTPERANLRAIQTPQAFRFADLLHAHEKAAAAGLTSFSDDGAIAEWAGLSVTVVQGDAANLKLTHPRDFETAERYLEGQRPLLARFATGFDVHAFADGDHVWLGGICVPHDRGVAAHSDGDVILHALTDAVLGTLADGDIGVHFPPSDPRWKGASSDRFLADAAERVRRRGGVIDHLDATLLCEAPRLGPHRDAMRERIAAIAGLRIDQVSLKATTTEKLGFIGRREGLAAQAAATVRLPEVLP